MHPLSAWSTLKKWYNGEPIKADDDNGDSNININMNFGGASFTSGSFTNIAGFPSNISNTTSGGHMPMGGNGGPMFVSNSNDTNDNDGDHED